MDWTAPIDIYCERVGPQFWAEPVNALSNLVFLIAAIWAAATMRRMGRRELDLMALIVLAAMIGIGSFLFHTFANPWSALTDVVPIWSFVALIIISGLVRVGGVAPGRAVIGFLSFVGLIVLAAWAVAHPEEMHREAPPLNGSLSYAPAWIAMVGFAAATLWRRHPVAGWVLAATLTFTLSLTFRTIDLMICDAFPLGTHFLWHLLNGLMIGLLLQALLRAPPPRPV